MSIEQHIINKIRLVAPNNASAISLMFNDYGNLCFIYEIEYIGQYIPPISFSSIELLYIKMRAGKPYQTVVFKDNQSSKRSGLWYITLK